MKTRFLIAAVSTVLLVGCASTDTSTDKEYYPDYRAHEADCAPLIQDEKRNQKDLDAFCYTEATQDTLKCEKAKDERNYLRERRREINNRETLQFMPFRGMVLGKWVTCPTR